MFDFMKSVYDRHYRLINALVLIIIFLLCSHMFNDMVDRKMTSDFADHLDDAIHNRSYSLMGFMMKFSYQITHSAHSVGYLTAFLVVFTILISSYYVREILKMMDVEVDLVKIMIMMSSTLFICKLCIPDWSPFYYWNSFSTQPWHSSTYILMRLFAMLTLLLFFRIQRSYLEKIDYKQLLLFAILMFLVNFAKPNFVIAFAPVMLMILIKDFIKTKGKSFFHAFLFGVCVLFGCTILLFQSGQLYPEGGNTSVTISFANALKMFSENKKYFFDIPFNYAFPLYVLLLIINDRKLFSKYDLAMYRQSWFMLLLSMLEFLFIREVGFRETHYNFRWGQQFFSYLIFIMSIVMLIKLTKKKQNDQSLSAAKYIYITHVVFGVAYFMLICLLHYFYLEI